VRSDQQDVELFENRCCVCFVPIPQYRHGRLRRTCSAACRQKLYRMRRKPITYDTPNERVTCASPTGSPDGSRGEGRMDSGKEARRRAAQVCPACGGPISQPARGRKRKTCSARCRQRLWRRRNPRCLVCGKHFKMAKRQREQKYCSKQCKWRAGNAWQRQRERAKARVEMAHYRPEWMPRAGSGYRREAIPWEGGEAAAVVAARKPEPNYWERNLWEDGAQGAGEDEAARRAEAERQAQMAEREKELRRQREARRVAYELLEDESKWWGR
jgi:hypothetical protein